MILIVGAGFSGAVIARELADKGYKIVIIDKRDHIGGNAYDYNNELGIKIHKYGPHLFHTNNKTVFDWLSNYTEWTPYKHKVKAVLSDGLL
jgi:UDP-galactopyranose mutase